MSWYDDSFTVSENGIYEEVGNGIARLVMSKQAFIEAYKKYIGTPTQEECKPCRDEWDEDLSKLMVESESY